MMRSQRNKRSSLLVSATLALALAVSVPLSAFAACTEDSCDVSAGMVTAAAVSPPGNGNVLYHPLKITGTGMPEEQIFSVKELLEIKNESGLGLEAGYSLKSSGGIAEGLDLKPFLKMCGADLSAGTVLTFCTGSMTDGSITASGTKLTGAELSAAGNSAVLLMPEDGKAGAFSADSLTLMATVGGKDIVLKNVGMIMIGAGGDLKDPRYGMHDTGLGGVLSYMGTTQLTVNYLDGEKAEKPFKTFTFTISDIEKMMREHPEQTFGNYFGMSGNEESKVKMGLGGFFDYFEGISMGYLLREKCGLKNTGGSAVFYDREGKASSEVKSLSYFFGGEHYLEIDGDTSVSGVTPIIGVSKNGAPLLPRHDHEMEGNLNYNTFNTNANAAGFKTQIGLVKNVSGPMIAGLPDMDGAYGGYRQETSGSCIRIDLIVDRNDYPELTGQSSGGKVRLSRTSFLEALFLPLAEEGFGLGEYLSIVRSFKR